MILNNFANKADNTDKKRDIAANQKLNIVANEAVDTDKK